MKSLLLISALVLTTNVGATIHVVQVWDGYFQFLPANVTMDLGDTIEWRKLDDPTMTHTITSATIPNGAAAFDQVWQMPADTFFQYIPTIAGTYDYVCTPHVSMDMVGQFVVNDTLSVNELNQNAITLFPNPSADVIVVEGVDPNTTYDIRSIDGALVGEGILNKHIDISSLETGTYVLLIADRNKGIRFVKR